MGVDGRERLASLEVGARVAGLGGRVVTPGTLVVSVRGATIARNFARQAVVGPLDGGP